MVGCGLLGAKEERREAPLEVEAYAEITLNGQPWRPDSALGALDLIFDSGPLVGERYEYLGLSFILRDPTPELPFYEAVLWLSLYEKPLKSDTTYYLFNSNPHERERVANGYPENFLGRMGMLSESEGDAYLGAFWIAREDSLRSWVRFSQIDTVQTEPFLLVFYEGSFEVVLSPFSRDPAWSRYPNEKLHFAGRFRVPAVTWEYLHQCGKARNCLRVRLRTL
ncbi:hypothetical protein [Rhodothermus marinus]|uniref:hypothetical protein n=1 Tax=Rhodothermus marinus TaxID=29549 RepID=UPI0006D29D9C|nr:hypothetical protein [Rhodothermus marinus]